MITIKEFKKYENANAIEVTWVEEEIKTISIIVEKEIDGEIQRVKENKDITAETIIHCQSFSDSQIDLLRQTAKDFNTTFTKEQEKIIADVIANIVLPTKEELEELKAENEKQRILSIKQEAGRIIKSKYPIEWQLNHPRVDATYENEYAWIDNIRAISNNAEINGTSLENIDWDI